MTPAEIEAELKTRECAIVEDGGRFAMVYPHGYELRKRSRDLLASCRSAALVEAWLWLHPDRETASGIETVQRVVAEDFGLPVAGLKSRDRSEPTVTARRIAMALARELTAAPLQQIGEAFDRDHGTVIYARDSVASQCQTEDVFAARVGTLRAACSAALTT